MKPLLFLFAISVFGAAKVHAAGRMSIDQAIVASEESSFDAQMMQDDHSIMVELDMIYTPEQWEQVLGMKNGTGRFKRNALRALFRRWTNAVVPYQLSGSFSSRDQEQIKKGINEWNRFSCVNIRPKTGSDKRYVQVVTGGGCSSMVGMQSYTPQKLTLGNGCRWKGVVAHEFGHALGFHHEQTRPDRDQHVRILTQNIHRSMVYNFQKYDTKLINTYDVPYDYESIMHYGRTAFSMNGRTTIETIDPKYQKVIGNNYGISFYDIKLINLMYDCNKKCDKKTCPGDGFVGKDCKCWCKGPSIKQPAIFCDTKKPVGGGNSVGPTPTKPTTGLTDNHPNCAYWAKRGECEKNPRYMLVQCEKSCDAVEKSGGGGGSDLKDNHPNCPDWAKRVPSECKRNPGYMLYNCKKSCKAFGK